MVLRYATRRGNQRGLGNLRFAAIDAQRFLTAYLVSASVREIHCYHPQPFYESRDAHKRLLSPSFLARVHEVLEPKGLFVVQTDNAGYWEYVKKVVPALFDFHEQFGPWPDTPKGRTRREILAMRRRYPVYRGWGVRKEMTHPEVNALVETLPPPTFDAGPRRKDLDALERE
jgi:tRNA (guanine-N7-)-methyltransferase